MKRAPMEAVFLLTAALGAGCESDCKLHYPPDSTVAEDTAEALAICDEGRANLIACVNKDPFEAEYFDCDLSGLEDNLNEANCESIIGVEKEGDVGCLNVQGGR